MGVFVDVLSKKFLITLSLSGSGRISYILVLFERERINISRLILINFSGGVILVFISNFAPELLIITIWHEV